MGHVPRWNRQWAKAARRRGTAKRMGMITMMPQGDVQCFRPVQDTTPCETPPQEPSSQILAGRVVCCVGVSHGHWNYLCNVMAASVQTSTAQTTSCSCSCIIQTIFSLACLLQMCTCRKALMQQQLQQQQGTDGCAFMLNRIPAVTKSPATRLCCSVTRARTLSGRLAARPRLLPF